MRHYVVLVASTKRARVCFVDSPAITASVPCLSFERMVDNTARSFLLILFFVVLKTPGFFRAPPRMRSTVIGFSCVWRVKNAERRDKKRHDITDGQHPM